MVTVKSHARKTKKGKVKVRTHSRQRAENRLETLNKRFANFLKRNPDVILSVPVGVVGGAIGTAVDVSLGTPGIFGLAGATTGVIGSIAMVSERDKKILKKKGEQKW